MDYIIDLHIFVLLHINFNAEYLQIKDIPSTVTVSLNRCYLFFVSQIEGVPGGYEVLARRLKSALAGNATPKSPYNVSVVMEDQCHQGAAHRRLQEPLCTALYKWMLYVVISILLQELVQN